MPRKNAPTTEDFQDLQGKLAGWRSSHPPRSPLPEEFWTEAVALARKHGSHRTARTLPIDYVGLRKRLGPAAQAGAVARPQFVELFPEPVKAGCCVEILRVQVNGPLDWSRLLQAWRAAER